MNPSFTGPISPEHRAAIDSFVNAMGAAIERLGKVTTYEELTIAAKSLDKDMEHVEDTHGQVLSELRMQ